MNWEKSKASTPLKRDFLRAWFAEEQRFFLTGGSALGIFYLQHRLSYDLDLFSENPAENINLKNQILRIGEKIGADVESLQSSPDFQRFRLVRDPEVEVIDLVIDRSPQLDHEKNWVDGIKVDTVREIIANKISAIFGRCETKDLIDLYFLEKAGHDIISFFPDAQEKDGGLDPSMMSFLLDQFPVTFDPEWMIQDLTSEDLRAFRDRLRLALAEQSISPSL